MAKENKNLMAHFKLLKEVGNYSALRKLAKSCLSNSETSAEDKAKIVLQIESTEPDPLVFWVGAGSVVFASVLAVFLTH